MRSLLTSMINEYVKEELRAEVIKELREEEAKDGASSRPIPVQIEILDDEADCQSLVKAKE